MEEFFPATFRMDVKDERDDFFTQQEGKRIMILLNYSVLFTAFTNSFSGILLSSFQNNFIMSGVLDMV